jgi:hypothetical protein
MRAGQAEIQTKLCFDYRTNIESYAEWQRWIPDTQQLLLVLWG